MMAMRSLKRRLSNIVYARMVADQQRRDQAMATGREGNEVAALTPARPAHNLTPALRTSLFPDPPRPSLEPRYPPCLDLKGCHERSNSVAWVDSVPLVAELARAVAALRITAEDLVPSEVSALLGCEPTKAWAKGDSLTSPRPTRTASFGMWRLHADETEPADLDAQVTSILGRLTSNESAWAELRVRYDVNLFCGWFMEDGNEGVSIKPRR